jgi:ubiquitin-activating enzyme E1
MTDFDANKATKAMDQYSRQIGTIGVEAMQRLASLRVLVIGAKGVGIEVAKNIALLGASGVTIADDEAVVIADLGTNYWLCESDVGKARAEVCLTELAKLNPFTDVTRLQGNVTDEHLTQFGAVIVTVPLARATLERWGDICHNHSISVNKDGMDVVTPAPILFIVAMNLGAAAFYFSDIGNSSSTAEGAAAHVITDDNGEPPIVNVVESLTFGQDDKGTFVLVRIPANKNHGLDDGDQVYFSEVKIAQLCDENAERRCFTVERKYVEQKHEDGSMADMLVCDHFVVRVPGCAEFAECTSGGFATQVKKPKYLTFRPFSSSVVSPVTESCVFGSMLQHPNMELVFANRGEQLHFALLAMWRFQAEHGHLPRLHSMADAEACVELANKVLADHRAIDGAVTVDEIDRQVVLNTVLYAAAELPSNCAFLGGIAAQEIVKKSGKYTPMHQWLYYDLFEALHDSVPSDAAPIGSRYDHQISIFGKAFQDKVGSQRWFMVGCGALGCEYLKAFALMGLGANGGEIEVTDNDRIEVSNLNRQFLFRAENVGHPKSVCAAAAAKRMNPAMNIKCHEIKVCTETENVFNTAFWQSLDGVCNALDNVLARRYTDSRCVMFKKPLLESGTLGTKANSEIIIPFETLSYNDVKEADASDDIPMCTLKLFPHLIEHCIEWARADFHDVFEVIPKDVQKFASDRTGYFTTLKKAGTVSTHLEKLRTLKTYLSVMSGDITFNDCLQLGANLFLNRFRDRILDLTHSCPEDYAKLNPATGVMEPFWSGTKRFPQPANLPTADAHDDDWALGYLRAATNLFAFMFQLPQVADLAAFRQALAAVPLNVPQWVPPTKAVNVDETADDSNDDDRVELKALEDELRAFDASTLRASMTAADFEKDDDTNFHIDFITAASNMRAANYHIKQATRFTCKMIAGRITPALATTTAMITGVTVNEMYKFLLGVPASKQLQSNVNLATASFNVFEVLPPKKAKAEFDPEEGDDVIPVPDGWNAWNTITVPVIGLTVKQLVAAIGEHHHSIVATSLMAEDKLLYKRTILPTNDRAFLEAALNRPVLDVITDLVGKPAGEYVRLNGSFETAGGDPASIPPLYVKIA